jgi:hypothetical protein
MAIIYPLSSRRAMLSEKPQTLKSRSALLLITLSQFIESRLGLTLHISILIIHRHLRKYGPVRQLINGGQTCLIALSF